MHPKSHLFTCSLGGLRKAALRVGHSAQGMMQADVPLGQCGGLHPGADAGRGDRRFAGLSLLPRTSAITQNGPVVITSKPASEGRLIAAKHKAGLIAAAARRVLVSRDVRTVAGHFTSFLAAHESPGLILIPPQTSIGEAIEGLLAGIRVIRGSHPAHPLE
jgi:hypothetical protein